MQRGETVLAVLIVSAVVGMAVVSKQREETIAPRRGQVAAFTERFVAPHNKLTFKSPMTVNHVGNHMIWVACMQPEATCSTLPCILNAVGRNATAAAALCAAVKHDCPSEHCSVMSDCNSMGAVTGGSWRLYVHPCDDEPSEYDDYSYADKILVQNQ